MAASEMRTVFGMGSGPAARPQGTRERKPATSLAHARMDTKPFDIITEADARVLPPGTTVRLARPGHVTPLADDTLRARRITVVRDDGVPTGAAEAGIVIDGAGLGSAIAANKVRGIRAAMCATPTVARYAREHNGANVLALGATLISPEEAIAIVETFLSTSMKEARYIARLAKIKALEGP